MSAPKSLMDELLATHIAIRDRMRKTGGTPQELADRRAALIRRAYDFGETQTSLGDLLGLTRQRIHVLLKKGEKDLAEEGR